MSNHIHPAFARALAPYMPDDDDVGQSAAVAAHFEREELHAKAFAATQSGVGPFWVIGADGADMEFEVDIFFAVRDALRLPSATSAQRWQFVQRVINKLADDYAVMVADGEAS